MMSFSKEMSLEMNDVTMYSLLECHICMEDMTENIMSCRNGHTMCDICYYKLYPCLCPFCKIPLDNIRNIPLEKFLKKLKFKNVTDLLNDSIRLCDQCSKPMDTHVGTCLSGHNFCRNCNNANSKCRICKSGVLVKRNLQVECCLNELKQLGNMQMNKSNVCSDSMRICPLSECSVTCHNLTDHIMTYHKSLIVTLELNKFYRLAVKQFKEKSIFLAVAQNIFHVRVKVIQTFISIVVQQINKGPECKLHIQNRGKYPIGFYKFKYANNNKNKKIILGKENLQRSRLEEYIINISICK